MKDYEEMAQDVLSRIGAYKAQQNRRRRIAMGTVTSLVCVCLVVLIGVGVWQGLPGNFCIQDPVLSVPAIRLPGSGSAADMIGLVVYKGGIYTHAEEYVGEDAQRIAGLVGDYLGNATGSINEWSKQEEYAEEFAATITGRIYAVKGYSTDFRLCTVEDDGNYILFLDRLNGIELTCGEDLFGQKLNLRDRIASIQYQSHADWNQERGNYRDAAITAEELDAFVTALYANEFEYTYQTNPNIYNSETQAHLYLNLTDGTTVELRLIEGGYVGYQALGNYFVKMPGETFDTVMNACQ